MTGVARIVFIAVFLAFIDDIKVAFQANSKGIEAVLSDQPGQFISLTLTKGVFGQ